MLTGLEGTRGLSPGPDGLGGFGTAIALGLLAGLEGGVENSGFGLEGEMLRVNEVCGRLVQWERLGALVWRPRVLWLLVEVLVYGQQEVVLVQSLAPLSFGQFSFSFAR